jgi:hypothetical protein
MMDHQGVITLLGRAIETEPEPPLGILLDDVTAVGRRLRHKRRWQQAGVAVVTAGALTTAASWVAGPSSPGPVRSVRVAADRRSSAGSSPRTSSPTPRPGGTIVSNAIARTIEATSPAGWSFDWSLQLRSQADGAADDGRGPGRISVGLSSATQQVHPCQDPEFAAGASCTERTLSSGAVLSERGLQDDHGIRSILVALTYPDGSGVSAEAGNYILPKPERTITGATAKTRVTPTRSAPTYTLDQLVAVVLAVDSATRPG